MSTETRILDILARELEIPLEELEAEEEISMEGLPEWDSLRHTQILLVLEKEFNQSFNAAEAGQATSLDALLALIG